MRKAFAPGLAIITAIVVTSVSRRRLAGGSPGVILSLERGRLHAMFDKITGSEPRVVQTPGALLAVRGTQYDVEVGPRRQDEPESIRRNRGSSIGNAAGAAAGARRRDGGLRTL